MAQPVDKSAEQLREAFEEQIAEMRKEIKSLTKNLSKQGSALSHSAHDTASELYDTVRERGADAAKVVTRQARHVTETAKENPLATVAIIAGIGLLIGLLSRR